MKAYADLGDLAEDDRIAMIGQYAAAGHLTGFVVDDDQKADRYIQKLLAQHKVRLVDRGPFPGVANVVLVRIGPAES